MNNKNDFASKCPVDRAMDLLNKKWHIQIIKDLFFGKKHFKEFKEDKPNLSNKVLSNCLKDLENKELINKTILENGNYTEYSLTEKGLALNKVIYELAMFTLEKCDDFKDDKHKANVEKLFKNTLDIN
ncbi:winged helix-turn-helix transcriptional regulator [Methanobrevibacter sp. DSM 116169]|uniref:winged helix-turn-helix transcriptional regulator n=1 Tax=Methanobrevibacter sp. DSM 116169 TaxID=3242727 RepID=UPI0038FCDFAC